MARDINLTSQKWNDIIFERRNKDYGAYEIRQSSSKRHIIAFLLIIVLVTFIAFLPLLIETVVSATRRADNISESSILANLKELEDQIQEKDIIREETAPPPPPLKSTIQFTAPEIVESNELDENEMKSQEELTESKVQISVATVEGTDDEHGIDIADLEKHKIIAEEKEEKVYEFVEQSPEFPGGAKELLEYLSKNVRYPAIAIENNIQGRVTVRFVVDTKGNISDVTILKGVDPSLDKEAIRLVKSMPQWIPGKTNGRAVKVYFNVPINFQLQ
jgi:protein TonB